MRNSVHCLPSIAKPTIHVQLTSRHHSRIDVPLVSSSMLMSARMPASLRTYQLHYIYICGNRCIFVVVRQIPYRWLTGTGSSPGEYIIRAAVEEDVGLILMGTRGLGRVSKVFLGSVSDFVLRQSPVPVIIHKHS